MPWVKLADPATLPTGSGTGATISSDGMYAAVSHNNSPYISIYLRESGVFVKCPDPADLSPSNGWRCRFTPDAVYLAMGNSTSGGLIIYKRFGSSSNIFTKLADVDVPPAGYVQDIAFTWDASYMAVALSPDAAPWTGSVMIYKRSGDTFSYLATLAIATDTVDGVAFSRDGTYLAVAFYDTPYVAFYKRSGDTFTILSTPASLPTGRGIGAALSSDGIYAAIGHMSSPYVTIYRRYGDTFFKLTDPDTLPTGTGSGTSLTPAGMFLAVGHTTSPYLSMYQRVGETDIYTKIADPATLPGVNLWKVSISSGPTYLVAASLSSPFIHLYYNDDPPIDPSGLPFEREHPRRTSGTLPPTEPSPIMGPGVAWGKIGRGTAQPFRDPRMSAPINTSWKCPLDWKEPRPGDHLSKRRTG